MIARIWVGQTPQSKADGFLDYLNETGVPDIDGTPGNMGVFVLRRALEDRVEFMVLSLWESMEAAQRFSGRPDEEPRYYPRDREFLLELHPNAEHYEVVVGAEAFTG